MRSDFSINSTFFAHFGQFFLGGGGNSEDITVSSRSGWTKPDTKKVDKKRVHYLS